MNDVNLFRGWNVKKYCMSSFSSYKVLRTEPGCQKIERQKEVLLLAKVPFLTSGPTYLFLTFS